MCIILCWCLDWCLFMWCLDDCLGWCLCLTVRMGFASSTACMVDALSVPGVQLPALRWELFRSRNLEGKKLPPSRATLMPHILRTNFVAMRDKSYTTPQPCLLPLVENGWMLAGDDRVCPSPVSLQTSTSCRLGTDQMWSLLIQEEQPPLNCSLQMPHFGLQ